MLSGLEIHPDWRPSPATRLATTESSLMTDSHTHMALARTSRSAHYPLGMLQRHTNGSSSQRNSPRPWSTASCPLSITFCLLLNLLLVCCSLVLAVFFFRHAKHKKVGAKASFLFLSILVSCVATRRWAKPGVGGKLFSTSLNT